MTYNYAPLVATAKRLLAKFGQTVTLSRTTYSSYDPVTGVQAAPSALTQTTSAVLLDYSVQESGMRFADGGSVGVGDKKILVEAAGWVFDATTTLTDATGVVWQVERVRVLAPSGVPLLYTCNGKR